MLVSVSYQLNTADRTYSVTKTHKRQVMGTAAQVGSFIADLLLEDHPEIHGQPTEVVTMKLDIEPDPQVL